MNILIIEDSKTINNIIKKELIKLSHNADQAFTLKKARELLSSKQYDLIILDLHLPDGEGSELIAHIQSLTKTKVVVLTSSQDDDLREELFQYGILDYIIKDTNLLYSITEIIKIINQITSKIKGKILIIDDSKFICNQIKTILEPRNYTIDYSYNAENGLKMLKETTYNLLILDMELPDIHGLEVLKLLRNHSKYINLPILVLSGTSTPNIIRDALKNGANDFLKKPFIFEEFILKVDLWIDYFKKEVELIDKTSKLEFTNNNLKKIIAHEVKKNREKDKIMFHQSRHAQMGEMIAMIAHQWRQPLNAISATVTFINQKVKMNKFDAKTSLVIVSKMHNYVQHLSSTIDDFRTFFKPEKEKILTDFEIICKKALNIIEITLTNKNIILIKDIKNTKKIFTYENELIQVIINLLKNSEDILTNKNIKNPIIEIKSDGTTLSIWDNGGGIDDTISNKIFDPYFSTKSEKEGTGLGLYMSKIIVEKHCHGKLSTKNHNNGTIFTIDIPQKSIQK